MRTLAANFALGIVGAAILTAYLVGFLGERVFQELSKENRS